MADDVTLDVRYRPGVQRQAFLLLHGPASNTRLWDEVAGRLAVRGHPVYTVDLRGHGAPDTSGESDDTATAAADLTAVGAARGLSGVIVAGHSWGAGVALRLAAENPALVAGLAMVDVRSLWDEPASRWYPSVAVPVMLLPAHPPEIEHPGRIASDLIALAVDVGHSAPV